MSRRLIGSGGFGAVYRAFQPLVGREVAIKVILPDYANKPDFIRRFESEAQLVARLEHPAKNHLPLIAAFEQFKAAGKSDWQLALAGSDWHGADDMGRWWVPSFCVPAPARKKCRKDVALEH